MSGAHAKHEFIHRNITNCCSISNFDYFSDYRHGRWHRPKKNLWTIAVRSAYLTRRRKALKNAKSVPFGLTLNNWSPQLKKDYSLTSKNGVIVRYVTPGSAGDRSGLYAGDVILKIDGKNIKSIKEFYSKCKKKTRVLVWLERNSEFYFLLYGKVEIGL